MITVEYAIAVLWAISLAALGVYVAVTARQITYVTLADGRRQERRMPVLYRLLLPFAPNFNRFFERPRYARRRDRITRDLLASGYEGLLVPAELLSLRVLMPIFGCGLFLLFYGVLLSGATEKLRLALMQRQMLFLLLIGLWMYLQPAVWLQKAVKERHRTIERGLPFVLDLLTLSVEAGLDFMTAIKRIIDRRHIDALSEELIRMFREVQLGKTRREALRNMADRSGQTDLRSVVNALVQADELGVSIGAILRIQSDQLRTRRFQRAEKAANEAPVKMLFPLLAFIFPSVFIVLLGPIAIQILKQGF